MPKSNHGLLGVVHVPAMPGDPNCPKTSTFSAVYDLAMKDAQTLFEGGVDGLILENFGSTPFVKGCAADRIPAHQTAFLAQLSKACVDQFNISIGINCLRNDALSALGIAASSGAHFVRVNIHNGAYLTDQGLIEGEAAQSLRYRQSLNAEHVAILADVLVKHAKPLTPLSPQTATEDTLFRALADGVIVTGDATGAPVSLELLQQVREAAKDEPVFIGSGLNPESVDRLLPLAEGAIVGTWLKEGGDVRAPVDLERTKRLVGLAKGKFRGAA